jgi:outer membrane lipoprotein LolB
LIKQALGSEIPVTALFAWLGGNNMEAAGWSADLSLRASGRIVARRMTPAPPTELLVLLD